LENCFHKSIQPKKISLLMHNIFSFFAIKLGYTIVKGSSFAYVKNALA